MDDIDFSGLRRSSVARRTSDVAALAERSRSATAGMVGESRSRRHGGRF